MGEGALADVVLLTPRSAYEKAKDVAKKRGEAVDPSRSRRGAVDWEDRAASVLLQFLIGYGEADLKFRLVEKEVKKDGEKRRVVRGFQVFRVYGGVEAPVGELWIGDVAYFKIGKEERNRFVEEAKREAPDLSGIKKIWHALPWLNTDASFFRKWIKAGTAHLWQAAWYVALFGEPKPTSGGASVAEEGFKPNVTMRWRREDLDRIIAEESKELEPLLGRAVKSWRELVDAIDWSWVLRRVEELVDELKPWIGPEGASDAEREGLVRGMLGELALLAHFAEARRGMDDGRWREERAKRLARVVEALSGGRITGDYAERLAKLIILYAEGYKKQAKERIDKLAGGLAGVSSEEVWYIVKFVLSDMYCLARDCARDEVVRKFVEPALELVMLDKALRGEFDREKAQLLFGEMYATAVAGDGSVGPDYVRLVVGGELGGGAALLRLATLHLLNQLLPDELKFDVRIYVEEGRYHRIAASGENAARLKRLLAVSAPSAGGEYLSPKFDQFVEEAKVEVQVGNISDASSGIAADLIISVGNISIKYNVYLTDYIMLEFESSDRSRAELAALLLRLAGVGAEVKKTKKGGRDVWYVYASTDMLAAGREELRKALIEIVKEAMKRNAVNTNTAERWLKKLESGRVLMEGWPKFLVRLVRSGALEVKYQSTNPDGIEQVAQRLEEMGLKRGVHFTVKMPEGGEKGYVSILTEGLAYATYLSVRGKNKQQRDLADEFVKLILRRAEEESKDVHEKAEEGKDVYKKALEIVNEGKSWGSLKLEDFEKEVEVNGKTYVVKVRGGEAVEEKQNGKTLLRIKIKAEVGRVEDGHTVEREYTITFSKYGAGNKVMSFAYARADPDGREADAERISALIEALTGKKPMIRRMKGGKIQIECYRGHLEGFMRFEELVETILKWLEETSR
jgi:Fe2+ transport system protein FeoA